MTYLSAAQIEQEMVRLEAKFPAWCKRFPLDHSREGRPISLLRIQGGSAFDGRRKVLITAGMHGREWAPPDALLSFVDELLTAYRNKSDLTEAAFTYVRVLAGSTKSFDYKPYVVE